VSSDEALERRRQSLLATIAQQRFALRSEVGLLRSSLPAGSWWQVPAVLASAAVGSNWLRSGNDSVSGALRLLRLARLAARCWSIALAAMRLARQ
jgi:hypothetical protein